MEFLFLSLYDYFKKNRSLLYGIFIGLFLLMGVVATQVKIEEDIARFFPNDKKLEKINQIFQHSKFMDKLVVMVSLSDSTRPASPDSLIRFADELVNRVEVDLTPYVKKITYKVDDALTLQLFNVIYHHLPLFLDEEDYASIDSLTKEERVRTSLQRSYRQLISPAGIALKKMIVKDPLGIAVLALKKLRRLQYDEGFELVDNAIFTKDHRYLIFFMVPSFPPNDTGNNSAFLAGLDQSIARVGQTHPDIGALYYGAAAVAAGNANQLRTDTVLTLSMMMVLLIVFLFGFLRKKRAPFIILIPVLFGGLFSLSAIYLIQGSISVLAIAAGSIILGIAVNYSLHFLSHLRHVGDVRDTIKDLVKPMTLGSATTVLAFLCLQFANASILRDVGLFAGFSLIGAAFCSLVFLPHLVTNDFFGTHPAHPAAWMVKLSSYQPIYNRILVLLIFLLTPVLLYYAGDVTFNSDLTKLNFMSSGLKHAENVFNRINQRSLRSIYIVADGATTEEALRHTERVVPIMEDLKQHGVVAKYSTVSLFIISDSLQRQRILRWNDYWTAQKKQVLIKTVKAEGEKLKFAKTAFTNFDSLLNRTYTPVPPAVMNLFRTLFFDDYITEKVGLTTVVTLASVGANQSDSLYKRLESTPHVQALDKRVLTNLFVSYVHADFTFIVAFTSALVFFVLLLSYGRLELTLITFIPMLVTWIWILGLMALLGIEFNIVNVMVSTFIFGLGDDYSIFIMDGLQQEYAMGRQTMQSIKDSILLSAVTTISGLGVLIFAQHPALKSIAAISIIGIVCVFVMSQTLEPFLFRKLISDRTRKQFPPLTLFGFLISAFIYFQFVIGAFVLTLIGFVFTKIIPFQRKGLRVAYHSLIRLATHSLIYSGFHVKKRILHLAGQYDTPKIIISNHESFLDILLTTMLHPKVLLFTNRWVWNSPVFGGVVRLADYYPIEEGAENSFEKLRNRAQDGYSILVFPEGARSTDGQMKRFHKGAFYLAEKLQLDILPLLLHGAGHSVPKGDFYVQAGQLTMKFLPAIAAGDLRFGATYTERTKSISRYFKEEHAKLAAEIETPYYYRHKLISNFLYKGPVLEWYLRIKLKLENYYLGYHTLVPRNASVLDLGCGYGFLSYMLHFSSKERQITGVDFDLEKITVAHHGYSRGEQLRFERADITSYDIKKFDTIIINDVLHYLQPDQQESLLKKCFEGLNPGGLILVREGDRDLKQKQKGTALTEFFSVTLLRFNKAKQPLHFVSGEQLRHLAQSHGLEITTWDDTKYTSNVTFVIKKKTNV
jgi:1-acyl-sn-glycerol-3-phosphate acyltransferase